MSKLSIAHFGLRSRNLPDAIDWYGKAFGAKVLYRDEVAAFMSFDEEHHRFVIWDDGETQPKSEVASGVDHIGFACDSLSHLADEYMRLMGLGIQPSLCVNHGFTCSIYYHDPDGNEVELTADNFPTKEECTAFMRSEAMKSVMQPPFYGASFDPSDLAKMRQNNASEADMAALGIN
ncbi:VOC family protein [Sphingorhabdus sp.]|uniref:VOC family protein n=1 Tax=Sphingorhabdus sp. TaxID=1902408 RepID=UPI00391B27D2